MHLGALRRSSKVLKVLKGLNVKTSLCLVDLRSLKLECEKLAGEKTEMQRHYVMVSPRCRLPHDHLAMRSRPAQLNTLEKFYPGLTALFSRGGGPSCSISWAAVTSAASKQSHRFQLRQNWKGAHVTFEPKSSNIIQGVQLG